jgi:hypothetical protein
MQLSFSRELDENVDQLVSVIICSVLHKVFQVHACFQASKSCTLLYIYHLSTMLYHVSYALCLFRCHFRILTADWDAFIILFSA